MKSLYTDDGSMGNRKRLLESMVIVVTKNFYLNYIINIIAEMVTLNNVKFVSFTVDAVHIFLFQ